MFVIAVAFIIATTPWIPASKFASKWSVQMSHVSRERERKQIRNFERKALDKVVSSKQEINKKWTTVTTHTQREKERKKERKYAEELWRERNYFNIWDWNRLSAESGLIHVREHIQEMMLIQHTISMVQAIYCKVTSMCVRLLYSQSIDAEDCFCVKCEIDI